MIQACKSAQIWKLIDSLPNRFETMVGERGHRLSGGEKQRLAIARLLLKSPSVVILDEATAHLDSENEQLVHAALQTALQGRTSIVIAHRLSTVRDADQILVLEKGSIVEHGTHDELVAKGGLYSDLYNRQDLTGASN
jgi:ATP-binding cassette subfamily B protein